MTAEPADALLEAGWKQVLLRGEVSLCQTLLPLDWDWQHAGGEVWSARGPEPYPYLGVKLIQLGCEPGKEADQVRRMARDMAGAVATQAWVVGEVECEISGLYAFIRTEAEHERVDGLTRSFVWTSIQARPYADVPDVVAITWTLTFLQPQLHNAPTRVMAAVFEQVARKMPVVDMEGRAAADLRH
jgi:hypothetical protein